MENLTQNILAISLGMMIFFSFVLAPMIFKILDPENAGKFVRKIFPYYYFDLLAPSNLKVSLLLFPLAVISVVVGFFIQKFISEKLFFNIVYILLFLSGFKLIFDAF